MKLCSERDDVVKELEMAEYRYIRSAYKRSRKDPEIKEPQRPIGRISSIPWRGDKVDLIEFYTRRLCELNEQIGAAQHSGSSQSLNSAFIQFRSQFGAHSAVQTVIHPSPFRMSPMYAEISPLDVVWDNMNLDTITRKGRQMTIFVISTVMILLWTIPTVVVSSLASISDIVDTFKFLKFLESLPQTILGLVQGVLPPLLLAGLMALLPFLLTIIATYEGHVRYSSITLSIMSKYFFFLVTNVLLISTLSGGVLKTIDAMRQEGFNFELVIGRFSEKLPESSTFFITYVLLRGFTGPVLELLQIIPLLFNFLFTQLLAKSPHQIWDVQGRLESVNYGILFPPQTLIFCIGIVYSTIAPLILPFVAFYFTMHYFVYRHQFLYVYLQPFETGGLAFPKAVKQVYTGIFISQITLFGLFLMKQAAMTQAAVPQLVLIVILIVLTILSLKNMNEAFDPLVTFLPVALFSKDLHVDKHGVVTEGNERPLSLRISDEEEGVGTSGGVTRHDNLYKKALNRMSRSTSKQENHDSRDSETENDIPTAFQTARVTFSDQSYGNTSSSSSSQNNTSRSDRAMPQHEGTSMLARPMIFNRPGSNRELDDYSAVREGNEKPSTRRISDDEQGQEVWGDAPCLDNVSEYNLALDSQSRSITKEEYYDSRDYMTEIDIPTASQTAHVTFSDQSYGHRYPSHGQSVSSASSGRASIRVRPVTFLDQSESSRSSRAISSISIHTTPESGNEQWSGTEMNPGDRGLEILQDQAYCHPAIYNVQRPVWLPMDERGLAREEIEKLRSLGIMVATDGAVLDPTTAKAKVSGIIYAPGEEARYRLERGE